MIPKFTQRTKINVKRVLTEMNVSTMFSRAADFSGMHKDLYIDDIIHECVVIVNEEGAEAAAATVVYAGVKCARPRLPPETNFIADHPFIYYIRHSSGMILFIGLYQ